MKIDDSSQLESSRHRCIRKSHEILGNLGASPSWDGARVSLRAGQRFLYGQDSVFLWHQTSDP